MSPDQEQAFQIRQAARELLLFSDSSEFTRIWALAAFESAIEAMYAGHVLQPRCLGFAAGALYRAREMAR